MQLMVQTAPNDHAGFSATTTSSVRLGFDGSTHGGSTTRPPTDPERVQSSGFLH